MAINDNTLRGYFRLFIVILIMFCVNACSGGGPSRFSRQTIDSLTFIPANAAIWEKITFPLIANDPALIRALSLEPIITILNDCGIAPTQISSITLYREKESQTEGYLVTATYQSANFFKRLGAKGFQSQPYWRSQIYSQPDQSLSLVGLTRNTILMGQSGAVRAILDVRYGKASSILATPAGATLAAHLNKQAVPIVIGILFSQETRDMAKAGVALSSIAFDLLDVGPLGSLLEKIGMAEGIGIEIYRQGNDFPIRLVGIMEKEANASFIAGSLNLLKNMGGMAEQFARQQNPEQAARMPPPPIRNMKISRTGRIVQLTGALARQGFVRE